MRTLIVAFMAFIAGFMIADRIYLPQLQISAMERITCERDVIKLQRQAEKLSDMVEARREVIIQEVLDDLGLGKHYKIVKNKRGR